MVCIEKCHYSHVHGLPKEDIILTWEKAPEKYVRTVPKIKWTESDIIYEDIRDIWYIDSIYSFELGTNRFSFNYFYKGTLR